MGWLQMSKQELRRVEVLTEVLAGSRTTESAAGLLGLSVRQTHRLLVRYGDGGGGALIHRARGRTSNNQLTSGVREYVLELIRRQYRDFGPTLATEVLLNKHQLRIGKETLRRWLMVEGLWLSRTQRKTFHQPRLRRESYGELVQIDGSERQPKQANYTKEGLAGIQAESSDRDSNREFSTAQSELIQAIKGWLGVGFTFETGTLKVVPLDWTSYLFTGR